MEVSDATSLDSCNSAACNSLPVKASCFFQLASTAATASFNRGSSPRLARFSRLPIACRMIGSRFRSKRSSLSGRPSARHAQSSPSIHLSPGATARRSLSESRMPDRFSTQFAGIDPGGDTFEISADGLQIRFRLLQIP